MAFHNLLSKCDQALSQYIISSGAGTDEDVFTLKRSLAKTVPCTIVECRRAVPTTEMMAYAGISTVSASIKIRTSGLYDDAGDNESAQPRTDSEARVASTFDLFMFGDGQGGTELAKAINSAAAATVENFTVLTASVEGVEQGFEREGFGWCDILHLELVCVPSTVTI